MWEKLMCDTVFQANFVNSFCTLRTLKIGCGGFILIPIKNFNTKKKRRADLCLVLGNVLFIPKNVLSNVYCLTLTAGLSYCVTILSKSC